MSSSNIIRWAGLSAVVAGVLTVATQVVHPADDPSSVATSSWAIAHYLILGSSVFLLLGISGLYARQVKEAGLLGFVGFLMLFVGLALISGVGLVEAIVMPLLATEAPQLIGDFMPGESQGAYTSVFLLAGLLYLLGSLLFGIAILRAGILPRWAAILFIVGIVSAVLAIPLPAVVGKISGVALGLGVAWLGYALWSERREKAPEPLPAM